jgi:hypothetical protein
MPEIVHGMFGGTCSQYFTSSHQCCHRCPAILFDRSARRLRSWRYSSSVFVIRTSNCINRSFGTVGGFETVAERIESWDFGRQRRRPLPPDQGRCLLSCNLGSTIRECRSPGPHQHRLRTPSTGGGQGSLVLFHCRDRRVMLCEQARCYAGSSKCLKRPPETTLNRSLEGVSDIVTSGSRMTHFRCTRVTPRKYRLICRTGEDGDHSCATKLAARPSLGAFELAHRGEQYSAVGVLVGRDA